MLLFYALACSTLQGGYLLFVSYLGTQAGLVSLKGLAAGEAGGCGEVLHTGPEGFENRYRLKIGSLKAKHGLSTSFL